MSEIMQNIPVIIHEPSFDAPKLPRGYKWSYRTDFHLEKVTLTVSIISTKNPVSALLFHWKKSKLSTLAQDFPRGAGTGRWGSHAGDGDVYAATAL